MDVEVLRWQDLVARTGSPDRARAAVAASAYRRVLRGAYVPIDTPDDARTRAAAVALVLPGHVVLSHWSALWLLGLDVLPRDAAGVDLLDVTVPRGKHLEPRPGIRSHAALLRDEDLCLVQGRLVASAARACVDVARTFGLVEGVACADAALRSGTAVLAQVEECVDRASGLRGVVTARAALTHVEPRSESLMESRLRVGFVLAGGPRLSAQVDLYDDLGLHLGRGDLYLDGVVVEYDGRAQRLEKQAFVSDRWRQGALNDSALEVRRFTSADYYSTSPTHRLARLLRALAMAEGRDRSRVLFGRDTLRPPARRPLPTVAESRGAAA